jgi:hypothetical protein
MSDPQTVSIDVTTPVQNIDLFLTGPSATNLNVEVIYPAGPIGPIGPIGPQGVNTWGSLTGDLSAQTDLWQYLSAGVGLDISSLNDYLSTNNLLISSATIYGGLSVGGDTSLSGNLFVLQNLDLSGSFFTLGSATITQGLSVQGNAYIDGTLFTQQTAIVFAVHTETIGNGLDNVYTVAHNLSTENISVIVKEKSTSLIAYPSIQVLDGNSVAVGFNFIPSSNTYDVTVIGGVPSNRINAYKQEVIIPERVITNTFYVSVSGSDSNSGTEIYYPLKTIKKACQKAHNARVLSKNDPNIKFTIFVGTGDYREENPIYVPSNTSLIGDNLRRASVIPNNRQYDIFWVDNSSYVWGFTFREHLAPGAATAFPDYSLPPLTAIALSGLYAPYVSPGVYKWRRPYITTSPYIQGSSSITTGLAPILQVPQTTSQIFYSDTSLSTLQSIQSSSREDVSNAFDNITSIISFGSGSVFPYSESVYPWALSAAQILEYNTEFIKKETITFIDTIYPKLVYDKVKYAQDIDLILSAVRIDIQSGNNLQTIKRGIAYYTGNQLNIPQNEILPTLAALNYAKRLANFITTNKPVEGLNAGCGMRVDGSLSEGFLRSMVLDSYTQFNENGKGIHILNNGYAQLVSIFTICCTEGVICETGGSASISNSNCSFGLSGLVAVNKSPTPVLSGVVINYVANPEDPFVTQTLVISGVEGLPVFPDSNYYPTLLNVPGVNLDTRKIAYTPYDGLVFKFKNEDNLYTISGTPLSSLPNTFTVSTIERINNSIIVPGTEVEFYIKSTIYASSHTFEFVGTGVKLRNAVPALGGVSTPETEVVFSDGGAVYYTSTNHTGDFNIGEEFKVVQSTGTIEGTTFKRSILTLVTPLNLALE